MQELSSFLLQKTEPKYQETLLYVKNINPKTSTENLGNFLEGGVGKDAEVKESSAIIQSRDRTEALVTFTGKPGKVVYLNVVHVNILEIEK